MNDVTAPEPTHWLNDQGRATLASFFQTPSATSDWACAYYIPARKVGKTFVPITVKDISKLRAARYDGAYKLSFQEQIL